MPSEIERVKERVRALDPSWIIVTEYARRKADERRISVERAIENILVRNEAVWRFSSFAGLKERRVEVLLNVSPRKAHKYIIEANS